MSKENSKNIIDNMYQLFLADIDDESREKIIKLDSIIDKYEQLLADDGGWVVCKHYLFAVRMVPSKNPLSSTKTVVCRVERTPEGFFSKRPKVNSYTLDVANEEERKLLETRSKELNILHKSMLTRDDIIYNRRYTLKNPHHEEMIEMIRQILGFNNPESTILPPKINEQKPTI